MADNEITLIDTWVLPENRMDESVARWRERVGLIHAAPGFRGARLHRRLSPESRLGLVNVARWDSIAARDEALANPAFTASAATTTGYATVQGGWYEVAAELHAELDAEERDLSEGRRQSGVTLVTVYELPAARIDAFLPYWRERAELTSKAPGFRGDRLHRAVDAGTRFPLVGTAHWDSPEASRTAANDPRFQPSGRTAFPDFAVADPALFRVAAEF